MGKPHRSPKDRLRRRSALDHLPSGGPPTGPPPVPQDNIYAYRMEARPYTEPEYKGMVSSHIYIYIYISYACYVMLMIPRQCSCVLHLFLSKYCICYYKLIMKYRFTSCLTGMYLAIM